jgi:hypothetical protein
VASRAMFGWLCFSCATTWFIRQDATPVFIAPYLTLEAQALCREQAVGFLDFEGNALLVFDGIFIERQVASKPVVERRELKSLFKPKSAQVLRVMLREPKPGVARHGTRGSRRCQPRAMLVTYAPACSIVSGRKCPTKAISV